MASFSKLRDNVEGDLEEQIARLTREVSSLKKKLAKGSASVYSDASDTASDLYEDVREFVTDAMPHVRKRARAVEQAAKDNPATAAAVGLVVVGLLVTMLARR